jgi:hypothetical protein
MKKFLAWVLLLAVGVPLFLILVNRGAFFQNRNDVVLRECGNLRLGSPSPAADMAREDLPFALLSTAAYDTAVNISDNKPPEWTQAEQKLADAKWTYWQDTPTDERFKKHNLRVQIWENRPLNAVVVSFGGTNPKKLADWWADFRWFIPRHNDEYTDVVQYFGTMFKEKYLLKEQQGDGEFLSHAKFYVTGHSLGGGLAQEFAYSVPSGPNLPRVTKVYAFDPSPVTGYYSVDKTRREKNREGLYIDRIYQRREILAILRSILNLLRRPSAENPRVREVRFDLGHGWNPVMRHSIPDFTADLETVATGSTTTVLPEPPPCPLR